MFETVAHDLSPQNFDTRAGEHTPLATDSRQNGLFRLGRIGDITLPKRATVASEYTYRFDNSHVHNRSKQWNY